MKEKYDYRKQLKQEMIDLIDQLEITDLQKRFMKARWLDQLLWLEGRSTSFRDRYHRLRMITITGGVIIPALVSLNITGNVGEMFRWLSFSVSQVVAITAATEEFFRYGDRWQQYRNTAEGLKIEGWQFFQLTGPYQSLSTHQKAYTTFANRVETIIKKDVDVYIAELAKEKPKTEQDEDKNKEKNDQKPEQIKELSLQSDDNL